MRYNDRYPPSIHPASTPKPDKQDHTAGMTRYQVPGTNAYIWASSDDEAQEKFRAYHEAVNSEGKIERELRISRERGSFRGGRQIKGRSAL